MSKILMNAKMITEDHDGESLVTGIRFERTAVAVLRVSDFDSVRFGDPSENSFLDRVCLSG